MSSFKSPLSVFSFKSTYALLIVVLFGLSFSPFRFLSLVYGVQIVFAIVILYMNRMSFPVIFKLPSLRLILAISVACLAMFSILLSLGINVPFRANHPIIFLNYIILAPLVEELLFRQAILGAMIKKEVPIVVSVLISALLFGSYHFLGLIHSSSYKTFIFMQVVFCFFIGIFLAAVRIQSNSLAMPIFLHSLVNSVFLIFLLLFY